MPLFLFLLFIIIKTPAFAGTTVLTTYYPPPVAAYNQVKLSTNDPTQCNGTNDGILFMDVDGTLHICKNGTQMTYPQACYNTYCTDTTQSCQPQCQSGFGFLWSDGNINSQSPATIIHDTFQISQTPTYVGSYVCCSI